MLTNVSQQIELLEIIRKGAMSVIQDKCKGVPLKNGCVKDGRMSNNCHLHPMCLADQTLKGLSEND